MPSEHLVLCGSALLSSRKSIWRKAPVIQLQIAERHGNYFLNPAANVHLKISDIRSALTERMADIAYDLLEIAAYVYSADQAIPRGGNRTFEYGEQWRRHFRFEIDVRRPDLWNDSGILDLLARTLGFLSDDDYEFAFHEKINSPSVQTYFDFSGSESDVRQIDEVLAFSGGLDSFAGAIDEIFVNKRRVVLVSHRSVGKVESLQRVLVDAIKYEMPSRQQRPLHVQVDVNKSSSLTKSATQRSRSFLYASIAAVVARLFDLNRIKFFENGVVGLNLPLSAQVLGGRATRTTHPRTLARFADLFSKVFDCKFAVENPFLWHTKADILLAVKKAGYSSLCAKTVSCAHTMEMQTDHPHCGRCSQCVDRRLVTLAARYTDAEDPPTGYAVDVLTAPRPDEVDRTLVESYVRIAMEMEELKSAEHFLTRFPELARAFNQVPLSNSEIVQSAYELYKRHAIQVCSALDAAATENVQRFRREQVPATSLLAIAFQQVRREPVIPKNPKEDNPKILIHEETFTVEFLGKKARFRQRTPLLFSLLRDISRRPGSRVLFRTLREPGHTWATSDPEDSTIRGALMRLKKVLKRHKMDELANCIYTGTIDQQQFVILDLAAAPAPAN